MSHISSAEEQDEPGEKQSHVGMEHKSVAGCHSPKSRENETAEVREDVGRRWMFWRREQVTSESGTCMDACPRAS